MLGVVILRWNGTFDSRWLLASMEISWKMCEWVAVYKSPREFLRLFADIHSDWMTTCITSGRFTWTHKHTRTHIVFFSSSGFQEIFQFDQILFDKWPSTLFAFWSPSLFAFMELLFSPEHLYKAKKAWMW